MNYYDGWTLGDLAGELMVRGIDIQDLNSESIESVLWEPTPEQAAERIAKEKT